MTSHPSEHSPARGPWSTPSSAASPGSEEAGAYELDLGASDDAEGRAAHEPGDLPIEQLAGASARRSAAVTASRVNCIGCGYDLSGTAVGGACPECGTPVSRTFQSHRTQPRRTNPYSITSLILGIVSLVLCGLTGPIAVIFGYVAYSDIRKRGFVDEGSKVMATIGLILGLISTALFVFGIVIALVD